jgi:hypothetical protein
MEEVPFKEGHYNGWHTDRNIRRNIEAFFCETLAILISPVADETERD